MIDGSRETLFEKLDRCKQLADEPKGGIKAKIVPPPRKVKCQKRRGLAHDV